MMPRPKASYVSINRVGALVGRRRHGRCQMETCDAVSRDDLEHGRVAGKRRID